MFSGKRGTRQISYVQKHTRVNMVATDGGTEKKTFDGEDGNCRRRCVDDG